MSVSGIYTTEQAKTVSTAQQTKGAAKTEYTNSVMTKVQEAETTTTTENNTQANTSKLDELKALCNDLGAPLDEVFHYPVENLPDEKLQKIIDALKLAIQRATTNNKVDKEKAIELGRKYCVAISSGAYTLEELKQDKNKLKGESISSRLERFFGLKEGAFSKLSETQKADYIKRYFADYFEELIQKSKDPDKIKRLQLRDYIKLLSNSTDEEKGCFKQVITDYLLSGNKPIGLFASLASFGSQEDRTKWADSWTIEEKAALGKKDQLGETAKDEDITAMQAALIRENSQESLTKTHQELNEKVTALLQKVEKGEDLTPEEELLYNTFKQLYAGEELGIPQNKVITDNQWKENFLNKVNNDIKEHGEDIYNDVIKEMAKAVEENSETLTMSKEDLEEILNSITDNKYEDAAASYITEKENQKNQNTTPPDIGFTPKEKVNTDKLNDLKKEILPKEDKPKFTVESPITKEPESLKEKFALADSKREKTDLIKKYFNYSPILKKAMENYIARLSNPLYVLNSLPSNARKYLAQKFVQKGKFDESDIQKLNLSFDDKQLLKKTLIENEKKTINK